MGVYRPIRTTATAIPDAFSELRDDLVSLGSATSGQINGTVRRLRETVEALEAQVRATPAVYARHVEISDWPSTKVGDVMTKASMTAPPGKSRCQVLAAVSGMCTSNGVHSDRPTFRVHVGQSRSPSLAMIPDNMDTWHILGQFSTDVPVTPGREISSELVLAGGVIYKGGRYIRRASLDVFFAFTN